MPALTHPLSMPVKSATGFGLIIKSDWSLAAAHNPLFVVMMLIVTLPAAFSAADGE